MRKSAVSEDMFVLLALHDTDKCNVYNEQYACIYSWILFCHFASLIGCLFACDSLIKQ